MGRPPPKCDRADQRRVRAASFCPKSSAYASQLLTQGKHLREQDKRLVDAWVTAATAIASMTFCFTADLEGSGSAAASWIASTTAQSFSAPSTLDLQHDDRVRDRRTRIRAVPGHNDGQGRRPVPAGVVSSREIGEWMAIRCECVDDRLLNDVRRALVLDSRAQKQQVHCTSGCLDLVDRPVLPSAHRRGIGICACRLDVRGDPVPDAFANVEDLAVARIAQRIDVVPQHGSDLAGYANVNRHGRIVRIVLDGRDCGAHRSSPLYAYLMAFLNGACPPRANLRIDREPLNRRHPRAHANSPEDAFFRSEAALLSNR